MELSQVGRARGLTIPPNLLLAADEVTRVVCCGALVRFWHKADKSSLLLFVRFRGRSGHRCLLALMVRGANDPKRTPPVTAALRR